MCIPWKESELIDNHCGSWNYRSPEMYQQRPYDPYKADVWALGVTFYEMTMGLIEWPSTLSTLVEVIRDGGILLSPSMPHDVAKLVRAMTQVDPEDRPPLGTIRRVVPRAHPDTLRSSGSMILRTRRLGDDKRRPGSFTPRSMDMMMVGSQQLDSDLEIT
jgi:serine/threonine protein kinase